MKTRKETITAKVYVFAEPKSDWEIEHDASDALPWHYKVKSYDYGDEESVRIMDQDVAINIPGDIDITSACIQNLYEQIEATKKEAEKKVQDLEDRIRAISLIEYKPDVPAE